jgi:nitric oxide reductase large subunit
MFILLVKVIGLWLWVGLSGKVEWLSRTRKLASQKQSREGPFYCHCWGKHIQVILSYVDQLTYVEGTGCH